MQLDRVLSVTYLNLGEVVFMNMFTKKLSINCGFGRDSFD